MNNLAVPILSPACGLKPTVNNYPYIIIDGSGDISSIREILDEFPPFEFLSFGSTEDALDLTIRLRPKIIFYNADGASGLSRFTNELYRYFKEPPKIIAFSSSSGPDGSDDCFQILDLPVHEIAVIKCLLKFERLFNDSGWATSIVKPFGRPAINGKNTSISEKSTVTAESVAVDVSDPGRESTSDSAVQNENARNIEVMDPVDPRSEKPLTICVKSYGDYRFIDADDIAYLKADNNSTDIHLHNGEMITAFKTLKHFESVLRNPFVRIHNSYIVNINYVSRIHTGNSVCYLKQTGLKLPFSKSYKENIDSILHNITKGNYLEI